MNVVGQYGKQRHLQCYLKILAKYERKIEFKLFSLPSPRNEIRLNIFKMNQAFFYNINNKHNKYVVSINFTSINFQFADSYLHKFYLTHFQIDSVPLTIAELRSFRWRFKNVINVY